MSNTELWDKVFTTDAAQTKKFVKGGGFSGTAIKPYYLIHRATETFGAIGIGWGFEEIQSKVEFGVWCSLVKLWYIYDGKRGECQQWGATVMAGKNKNGDFVDEEAAKKAVTDAVTKCLSYIGFAGDVHMGLFDDSKYVEKQKEEKSVYGTAKARNEKYTEILAAIEGAETLDDLKAVWRTNANHIKAISVEPELGSRLEEAKNKRKSAIEDHNAMIAAHGQDFVNAGAPAFLRKAQ